MIFSTLETSVSALYEKVPLDLLEREILLGSVASICSQTEMQFDGLVIPVAVTDKILRPVIL